MKGFLAISSAVLMATTSMHESIDDLVSPQKDVRLQALTEIQQGQAATDRALMRHLEEAFKEPDAAFYGRIHLLVEAIGYMRADDCTPELVKHIDFQLDPKTFPLGRRPAITAFYPVALALRDMGNRRVTREIVASLEQERPERVLRISAWVLAEIYGPDAAKTVIEKAAAGASGPKKTSLDWVRRILDEKGVLLPTPNRG